MKHETVIPGLPALLVQQICAVLKQYPQVEQAILFGSRAKGNHRPNSDVDISLDAPKLNFSDYLHLYGELNELLFPYSLDLVLKHQIDNPDLLEHIQRVGIVLYRS